MFYLRKKILKLAQDKEVNLSSSQLSKISFWEKQLNKNKINQDEIAKNVYSIFRSHNVYLKDWEIKKLLKL